jgi:hypothetical protein
MATRERKSGDCGLDCRQCRRQLGHKLRPRHTGSLEPSPRVHPHRAHNEASELGALLAVELMNDHGSGALSQIKARVPLRRPYGLRYVQTSLPVSFLKFLNLGGVRFRTIFLHFSKVRSSRGRRTLRQLERIVLPEVARSAIATPYQSGTHYQPPRRGGSLLVLVKVVLTTFARERACASLDLAQLARIRGFMECFVCHRGNGIKHATQLKMVNSYRLCGAVLGIKD